MGFPSMHTTCIGHAQPPLCHSCPATALFPGLCKHHPIFSYFQRWQRTWVLISWKLPSLLYFFFFLFLSVTMQFRLHRILGTKHQAQMAKLPALSLPLQVSEHAPFLPKGRGLSSIYLHWWTRKRDNGYHSQRDDIIKTMGTIGLLLVLDHKWGGKQREGTMI